MTETTTIRISAAANQRLERHRRSGESKSDVVTRLTRVPTDTENDQARAEIAAYLRKYLIRDFGNRDELTPGEQLWQELTNLQHRHRDGDTVPSTAVILDHTALSALTQGHRLVAQLIYTQPAAVPTHADKPTPQRYIYAPTQAVYTARVQHASLAHHLDGLEQAIEMIDFDRAATKVVGDRVPSSVTPAVAHVVYAAQESMDWPTGRPVLTQVPMMYQSYQIALRQLPEAA